MSLAATPTAPLATTLFTTRIPWALLLALLAIRTAAESSADAATSMAGFCQDLPRPAYAELTRVPDSVDDWFELYTVATGVTAIYEPHQWQEAISYLIEGDERALLFDTGNGIGDIHAVVGRLSDKPITVLNSHGHFDHVGGNHAFNTILGLDTPFTRERQRGQPNEAIRLEVSAAALCRPPPGDVTVDNHVGRPYAIRRFIRDGHRIDLGGRTLEVVHVPGHTPDAIALLDRDAGLMWTGDSYYDGPIWLYAPETDLAAYRASLQRMIEASAGIRWLLPAHNTPRVAASVLPAVLAGFDAMLAGAATRVPQGDGMVEYRIEGEERFSFLMRDEPLPYRQ
ncbi:MAG: MBL fold metallo-hydrolase [Halieaceae bacterium]|jgi:glyoxylase-like metal-dependent hydrolase (beta-lactamase superfamily II)|nr:MBL fold metallo-hydrolase [Halieaceae bacterium]